MIRSLLNRQGRTTRAVLDVFLGNITAAALAFLLNIVLARMLSVTDFGRFNVIFSLVVVLYTIGDFGFSNAVVVLYNSGLRVPGGVLATLNRAFLEFQGIVLPLLVLALLLVRPFYKMDLLETWVAIIAISCFVVYKYGLSVLQAQGLWLKFNVLNVGGNFLKSLIILSLCVAPLFAKSKYQGALVGYLLQGVGVVALVGILVRKGMHLTHASKEIRVNLWRTLWPIGMANIFIVITMRFGVLITERELGSQFVAVYSVANTLALVFPLFTSSMMNVLIREAALAPKHEFVKKLIAKQRQSLPYLLPAMLGCVMILSSLVGVLFGDSYSGAWPLFALLSIPHIGGIFFSPLESYFYGNDQIFIMKFKAVEMVLMVLVSLMFISHFGLYGVALGAIISRAFGWAYLYFKAQKLGNSLMN